MKLLFSIAFLCLPFLILTQSIDTIKIKAELDSLIELNQSLSVKRNFAEAILKIELAETKAAAVFGKSHAIYADCIFNHAATLYSMNKLGNAEKLYLEAKELVEKLSNQESPIYSNILNNLGLIYLDMGRYKEAEELLIKAKTIRESILGLRSAKYIASLQNLAYLYTEWERYELAESYFTESLNLHEAAFGKQNLEYTANLNNYANMYKSLGRYEVAERIYLDVLRLLKSISVNSDQDYCMTANNLGNLYQNMGRYEASEKQYLKVKTIREKNKEEETTAYANSLIKLGTLKADMGQLLEAEPYFLKAERIISNAIGKGNPQYAGCIRNLGLLYKNLNKYDLAKHYFQESKNIIEDKLGTENLNYANAISNLADLYMRINMFESAQLLYIQSLQIIERKSKGKENVNYIRGLHNLAYLKDKMGIFAEAEQLYLDSKKLFEGVFDENNLLYIDILNNLSQFYWKTNRVNEAAELMVRSGKIQRDLLALATRHLSESELIQYNAKFLKHMEQCLSLVFQQAETHGRLESTCYNDAIFYKGFFLTTSKRIKNLATKDSMLALKYEDYNLWNRQLYKEYLKRKNQQDSSKVKTLKESIREIEKQMVGSISELSQDFKQVNFQQIQAGLSKDEISIEFVRFKYYNPKPTDSILYGALIVSANTDQPKFIPLFEEEQLRQVISDSKYNESISGLYSSRGVSPIQIVNSKNLYQLIWKPLIGELAQAKKINYAPAGLLHRINFDAIAIDAENILSDHYNLVRLGSTRTLALDEYSKDTFNNTAYLFGGIDYINDNSSLKGDMQGIDSITSSNDELSFAYINRAEIQNKVWTYLPGTLKELQSISKLLKTSKMQATSYVGNSANEANFKSIGRRVQSPRILHIATHGYFFPDSEHTSDSVQKVSLQKQTDPVAIDESLFKVSEHPMIRSGVILAGANNSWFNNRNAKPQLEDGILTAFEISQMNLSNTELVVLSACETGLGDIQGHEGVYGLQRAFKIAGVKYIMMSLWQIPDTETKEFMVHFYKNWLSKKLSIQQAFSITQHEMRLKYTDPYKWAGFVLLK